MNKMKTTENWLPIAFLLSFLAVGIPYWLIPYNQVDLPSALIKPGLLVVVFAALLLRSRKAATFWKAVTMLAASVPAAVFARVLWDGLFDPTSHNLWPLEVVIALLVGFACAFTGAIVGGLISMLVATRTGGRDR
jgi:hypothetical protein